MFRSTDPALLALFLDQCGLILELMPRRHNYYYDEEMASGYPDHDRPVKIRVLGALTGLAAAGSQYAYSKYAGTRVPKSWQRMAADTYMYYKDRVDPDWVLRDLPEPRENPNRYVRDVAKYEDLKFEDPGWPDEKEFGMLVGNKTSGSGRMSAASASTSAVRFPPRDMKFGSKFNKPTSVAKPPVVKSVPLQPELDDPVKVELPDGEPSFIRPWTYAHDSDDLVHEPVSSVKVGDAQVLTSSLPTVSIFGGRTICNDDGEGAAMIRARNGRFYWQVGALRYPVQYSGKSVVPFSVSNGRYQFIIPSVNVS